MDVKDAADAEGHVSCGQVCGKLLPLCGHSCQMLCHPGKPCGTEGPCQEMVEVRCPCGHRVSHVVCGMRNDPEAVEEENKFGFGAPENDGPKVMLECDDECARIKRRNALAEAFDVDPLRGAPEYGDFLVQYAVSKPLFVVSVETSFHDLLSGEPNTLMLKPMDIVQRRVVHMLAKFYNITTHSEGTFSTGRYVVLTKQEKSEIPTVLLSEVAAKTKPSSSTFSVQPSVEDEEPLMVLRLGSSSVLDKAMIMKELEQYLASCDVITFNKCSMIIVSKERSIIASLRAVFLPYGIVID